jgi:hypothetical protein
MSVPAVTFELETNPWDAAHWFHSGCRFEVVVEQLELSGFQLYAVEKWYVPLLVQDAPRL